MSTRWPGESLKGLVCPICNRKALVLRLNAPRPINCGKCKTQFVDFAELEVRREAA